MYRFVKCIPRWSLHLSIIVHSPNLFLGKCLLNSSWTSPRALIPFSNVGVPNPVRVTLCHKYLILSTFGLVGCNVSWKSSTIIPKLTVSFPRMAVSCASTRYLVGLLQLLPAYQDSLDRCFPWHVQYATYCLLYSIDRHGKMKPNPCAVYFRYISGYFMGRSFIPWLALRVEFLHGKIGLFRLWFFPVAPLESLIKPTV